MFIREKVRISRLGFPYTLQEQSKDPKEKVSESGEEGKKLELILKENVKARVNRVTWQSSFYSFFFINFIFQRRGKYKSKVHTMKGN